MKKHKWPLKAHEAVNVSEYQSSKLKTAQAKIQSKKKQKSQSSFQDLKMKNSLGVTTQKSKKPRSPVRLFQEQTAVLSKLERESGRD